MSANCGIGPTGAAEIAEYMSGSAVLTELDLSCNRIGNEGAEGAEALASALRANAVLTHLNLEGDLGVDRRGWAPPRGVKPVLYKEQRVLRDAVSGRVGFELKM